MPAVDEVGASSATVPLGTVVFGCLFAILITLYVVQRINASRAAAGRAAAVARAEAERRRIEEEEAAAAAAGPALKIYFGSQTGTAEGFAKEIAEQCNALGFSSSTIDLEDFEADAFIEEATTSDAAVVFLMATYGEGDPTDNAIEFVEWIKDKDRDLDNDSLKNAHFSVFGLGNTQYEHYNAMGKLVNKRLEALGATRVYEYGEGDDDNNIDDDFETWREGLAAALCKHAFPDADPAAQRPRSVSISLPFSLLDVAAPEDRRLASSEGKFDVRYCTAPQGKIDLSSRSYFQCVEAKVVAHRELRQSGPGSTVHVEVDIGDLPITYDTADNLGVLPENHADQVEKIASLLGARLDSWLALEAADPAQDDISPIFPTPCTVRTALAYYCDLNAVPSRNLIGKLATYASLPEHKHALEYLSAKEGKEEYNARIVATRCSLVDLFSEYSSIRIPLGHFVQIAPRLQPRWYTISSSAKLSPTRIAMTVSVVTESRSPAYSTPFRGICSTHIANQSLPNHAKGKRPKAIRGKPGQWPSLRIVVRPSTFKMPDDPLTPIIMVGPGTGIAPMMALLSERYYQRDTMGAAIGESVLFLGAGGETKTISTTRSWSAPSMTAF